MHAHKHAHHFSLSHAHTLTHDHSLTYDQSLSHTHKCTYAHIRTATKLPLKNDFKKVYLGLKSDYLALQNLTANQ